jgi:alpha-L-fucosidase
MRIFVSAILLLAALSGASQNSAFTNPEVTPISKEDSPETIALKAAHVVPSPRQAAWQELEFTIFLHFGMNTFTNREWGLKDQDPALFNPTELDANQWARVAKNAGAKLMIIVAKHHDGFCLWPTQYTGYSVKASPWKGGKGDVVAEVASACKAAGLKLGIYLSPWDISSPLYGTEEYNTHFKNQLRELLTNYGEVAEVWFDGACGEGPNGKRQVYDWSGYYRLIRELQPAAVIAVMGPDVRWVGTETGYGRETEWSVVPVSSATVDSIAKSSQQSPGNGVFHPDLDMQQQDLGSREKLGGASGLIWYPSEVDVSIRPGWFWHSAEDSLVKSPETLVEIYYSSVGRNSVLLLNIPPDDRGLIRDSDIKSLEGMRAILDSTFRTNLAENAVRMPLTMFTEGSALYDLGEEMTFDCLMLQENVRNGQRVEEFCLEALTGGEYREVCRGTTIGYKRLIRFSPVTARYVRLKILRSRDTAEIPEFGLYLTHGKK